MRSLQSYADTVSARKRPRHSCSNCVSLAPQTSPESRIVWSLTVHRRRAPNSRPRADLENRAFWATHPSGQPAMAGLDHEQSPRLRRTVLVQSDVPNGSGTISRPSVVSLALPLWPQVRCHPAQRSRHRRGSFLPIAVVSAPKITPFLNRSPDHFFEYPKPAG